ncbi:Endoglucanase OS=Streptomyces tendae OX=1932 GN=GUR47_05670 PE=3 SV=1 [Streptomyces tendae]
MRTARRDTPAPPQTLAARLVAGLAALIGLVVVGALCPGAAVAQSPAGRAAGVQSAGAQAAGLHVSDGRLVEGNGNAFVMRGVNHAYTWYPGGRSRIADVTAQGANSVRVVLGSGDRWTQTSGPEDVAAVIGSARPTGDLRAGGARHHRVRRGRRGGTLDQAADYWIGVKDALAGQEDYVVVNIGNEPCGNTTYAAWTDATKSAVARSCAARGIDHALDGRRAQLGPGLVRHACAPTPARSSPPTPTGNTVFSIHMYGVYDTAAEVTGLPRRLRRHAKLPIVVGRVRQPATATATPTRTPSWRPPSRLGVGYIGWSWSGNGGGVESSTWSTASTRTR